MSQKYIPKWGALHTQQSETFQKISSKKHQTCSDYGDFMKWLDDKK